MRQYINDFFDFCWSEGKRASLYQLLGPVALRVMRVPSTGKNRPVLTLGIPCRMHRTTGFSGLNHNRCYRKPTNNTIPLYEIRWRWCCREGMLRK